MNQEIGAHELDTLLEQLPPQTKVLSLDCFDTILWRKVARPTDVFFSLQSLEPFRSAGITAALTIFPSRDQVPCIIAASMPLSTF